MPHTQLGYDRSRFEAYRLARRLMWREAYWDRDKAETVSLNDYEPLQVYRGDVIKQAHHYIHPALTATKPRKHPGPRTRQHWLEVLQRLPKQRLNGGNSEGEGV